MRSAVANGGQFQPMGALGGVACVTTGASLPPSVVAAANLGIAPPTGRWKAESSAERSHQAVAVRRDELSLLDAAAATLCAGLPAPNLPNAAGRDASEGNGEARDLTADATRGSARAQAVAAWAQSATATLHSGALSSEALDGGNAGQPDARASAASTRAVSEPARGLHPYTRVPAAEGLGPQGQARVIAAGVRRAVEVGACHLPCRKIPDLQPRGCRALYVLLYPPATVRAQERQNPVVSLTRRNVTVGSSHVLTHGS